jgi:hypothetical protein
MPANGLCDLPNGRQPCPVRCLLWVNNGHRGLLKQCPLYPQKQTFSDTIGMSALCQKRTWQLLRLYVDLLLNNNRKCERKCGALAGL